VSDRAPMPPGERPAHPPLPDWLEPIRRGAVDITVEELTRFVPPEGSDTRRGAVLMLFGHGPSGPDLLLTERAHDMRSHPGQVSFPGGSIDQQDASAAAAALREAEEETGVDPSGVEVFASLPELWLPPSNFAVTPVLAWWREESPVSVVDPREVHAVLREPIEELLDPQHRISVRHPSGWKGPAFLIGEDKDLILWGFTAGIIARLFDFVGWTQPWDASQMRDLPEHMLTVPREASGRSPLPDTNYREL
jgi:8-oxo-dGTP pyrophosphatase MutT (NUDIX family)